MSRRGRTQGAAISLFSFQDIITSVTAIMILLVLILTLELISRVQQRGVAAEDRRVARDLRASVAALEQQARDLRAELTALQSSANRSAAFDEAETRRREREATQRAAELNEEIDLLEDRVQQAASKRRRAENERVAQPSAPPDETAEHVAAMNERAAAMEQANEAERQRQQAARQAGGDRDAAPTLVFNRPPGDPLRPRLLEVSGDGLTVMSAAGEDPLQFSGPADGAFAGWLARLDRSSEYVVVILRPSGVDAYDTVVDMVKAANVGVGAELVGESMPVSLGNGG